MIEINSIEVIHKEEVVYTLKGDMDVLETGFVKIYDPTLRSYLNIFIPSENIVSMAVRETIIKIYVKEWV